MESLTKFWCFICKKEVRVKEKDKEIICSVCSSSFVEEIEENEENNPMDFIPSTNVNNTSISNNNTNNPFFRGIPIIPHVSFQIITSSNGTIQSRTFNSNNNTSFQNIIQQVNSLFTSSPQLNISSFNFNQSPLSQFLYRHNDDQQFENLLNFLMTHDPNRYGTPPASKKVVKELPREKVTEENRNNFNETDCLICMDSFSPYQIVTQLKCSHLFHAECIEDWLKLHNTCPVCRDEMVTDDEDYENRKNERRRVLREYNNTSSSGHHRGHHH